MVSGTLESGAGVGGGVVMSEVDFSDEQSAKAWFEMQSIEMRCAMTSRGALRVVANVRLSDTDQREEVALASLRAVIITAGRSLGRPSDAEDLTTAARSAAFNLVFSSVQTVSSLSLSSAINADAAARSALDSAESARSAARSAAEAADSVGFVLSRSAVFSAFSEDANIDPLDLCARTVWGKTNIPERIAAGHLEFLEYLNSDPNWAFWRRWYEQMWEGTFRDWDLAIEVAKIPDDVWEGDDALAKVAEKIRGIEAGRDLVEAIAEFKKARHTVSTQPFVPARGHNNPPELIDDGDLSQTLVLVWPALDDLEREALSSAPDFIIVKQALITIQNWFFGACKYVGRKLDLAIDTTVKWVIPTVGGGYLLMNPEKLVQIIQLAEAWLK